jgi:hypothetical protein
MLLLTSGDDVSDTDTRAAKRRQFHAPNSKPQLLRKWKDDDLKTAIAAIAYHHGAISSKRLAEVLGISPRGLRKHLIKQVRMPDGEWREVPGLIRPDVRGEKGRGELWYSLDPDFMPPKEAIPPLKPGLVTYDQWKAERMQQIETAALIEFKEDEE